MEIRQIRYAAVVARYSSFSKAASILYVTQQTLSQQIRRLEEEIGFELFERSTRTVSLTPKGKIFTEKAEALLNVYDSFSADVAGLKESTDHVIRMGILPTFQHLNILELIYAFQAKERGVSIQVHIQKSSRLIDMISQGSLDAAIGNLSRSQMESMRDDYNVHVFSKDHICAVMHSSHPLASGKEITLSDLEGQTLLMLDKGSSIRIRMENAFREKHLEHTRIIECPEIYAMTGMARSGTGIGFLSSMVAAQAAEPPLAVLPISPEMETFTALYYQRKTDKDGILERLADSLKNR